MLSGRHSARRASADDRTKWIYTEADSPTEGQQTKIEGIIESDAESHARDDVEAVQHHKIALNGKIHG